MSIYPKADSLKGARLLTAGLSGAADLLGGIMLGSVGEKTTLCSQHTDAAKSDPKCPFIVILTDHKPMASRSTLTLSAADATDANVIGATGATVNAVYTLCGRFFGATSRAWCVGERRATAVSGRMDAKSLR